MKYDRGFKDFAYKTIKELVEDGLNVIRGNSTDMQMNNWLDYSQKFVELATRNLDASIHLNYLRILISLQSNYNMPARQKINACLDYLIEVLEIIVKQY